MNAVRAVVSAMILSFAFTLSQPVYAKPDAELTCDEISHELDAVNKVIGNENGAAQASHAAGAGTAIAQHAGILSGRGLPFLGQVAGAASSVAGMNKARAEKAVQEAQMRKSTLTGIYIGRACGQTPAQVQAPAPVETIAQPQASAPTAVSTQGQAQAQ